MADKPITRKDYENKTYTDTEGNVRPYPLMGQGPAYPLTEEDIKRDNLGYTNPNLHRRIDPKPPKVAKDKRDHEYKEKEYSLQIMSIHSYRTTKLNVHNEESVDDETP